MKKKMKRAMLFLIVLLVISISVAGCGFVNWLFSVPSCGLSGTPQCLCEDWKDDGYASHHACINANMGGEYKSR